MASDATTFRPRNGKSSECFWRIRMWCAKNGFAFSDVLNAIMVPLAYYLENHCMVDTKRSMATIELNAGFVDILHVIDGRCYPLASQVSNRPSVSMEEIQEKIDFWKQRNAATPASYDLLLLKTNTHAQEKLKLRRVRSKAAA